MVRKGLGGWLNVIDVLLEDSADFEKIVQCREKSDPIVVMRTGGIVGPLQDCPDSQGFLQDISISKVAITCPWEGAMPHFYATKYRTPDLTDSGVRSIHRPDQGCARECCFGAVELSAEMADRIGRTVIGEMMQADG